MPNHVKVTFKRVHVTKAGKRGHGIWNFVATVDGTQLHPSDTLLVTDYESTMDLPSNEWSRVVDVSAKNQFTAEFKVRDNFDNSDIGSVQVQLSAPYAQFEVTRKTANFILEYSVELEVEGAYGQHPPSTIFATRASVGTPGASDFSTVSGSSFLARFEACDVRPTPPMVDGTDRPNFPVSAPAAFLNQGAVSRITADSPINVIPNPSVIPILTPREVTTENVARIELTYYRPKTVLRSEDDPLLTWSVVSLAGGGAVAFLGAAHGTKINVYGTAQGEVELQARFRNTVVARYRALVLPLKEIRCRANILNGPKRDAKPKVTTDNILAHVAAANRFLRQLGLSLVFDSTIVTAWFPDTDTTAISASPTASMSLDIDSNRHAFTANPNTLDGAVAAINSLNSGAHASIEDDAAGTSHRLVVRYNGDPRIRLIDAGPMVTTDIGAKTYPDANRTVVGTQGKVQLKIGGAVHNLKKNHLNGLRDAINGLKAGVRATVVKSGTAPNPFRIVLEPQPIHQIKLVDGPGLKTVVASAPVTHGAIETSVSGIFAIAVTDGDTRNVSGTFPDCTAFNWRPNVFNFAYIVNGGAGVLGSAIDRQNDAGASVTDNGTPSSSWKSPSGIPPHGAAGAVVMKLRPPRRRSNANPNPVVGLFSMWVATKEESPKKQIMKYGNTIAHELGHVLHLSHRGDASNAIDDGVVYPIDENVMHPDNTEAIAQDFDILQARAVRLSPLVP